MSKYINYSFTHPPQVLLLNCPKCSVFKQLLQLSNISVSVLSPSLFLFPPSRLQNMKSALVERCQSSKMWKQLNVQPLCVTQPSNLLQMRSDWLNTIRFCQIYQNPIGSWSDFWTWCSIKAALKCDPLADHRIIITGALDDHHHLVARQSNNLAYHNNKKWLMLSDSLAASMSPLNVIHSKSPHCNQNPKLNFAQIFITNFYGST